MATSNPISISTPTSNTTPTSSTTAAAAAALDLGPTTPVRHSTSSDITSAGLAPNEAASKLVEAIDDFLGDIEKKFKGISEEILGKHEMAERCDRLEQDMLMRETGRGNGNGSNNNDNSNNNNNRNHDDDDDEK